MKIKNRIPMLILIFLSFFEIKCKKDDHNSGNIGIPKLTTVAAYGITGISAFSGGNVTSDGGSEILEKGLCWNTSPQTSISDNKILSAGANNFTCQINGLAPFTTYYVNAYAKTLVGIGYGNEIEFTTTSIDGLDRSSFYGFLDGFSISSIEGQYGTSGRKIITIPIDTDFIGNTYVSYLSNSNMTLSILKGIFKYQSGSTISLIDFKNYFPSGSSVYADTSAIDQNGIQISYIDYKGEEWSTILGSQSVSHFNILNVSDIVSGSKIFLKIEAEFKCTIYSKSGHQHILKGTKFIGYFANK